MTLLSKWMFRSAALGCVAGSLLGQAKESHAQIRTTSMTSAVEAFVKPADPVPVILLSVPESLPAIGGTAEAPKGLPTAAAAPGAPAAAPAAPATPPAPPVDPMSKVPPVRLLPRPGNFSIPPSGPGYYSLLDVVRDECREKPPKYPYPPFGFMQNSFFDADFRYLDDPKNTQHDLFDPLHRIRFGDCWLFNTGGEFRDRTMYENNARLSGQNNSYNLFRVRSYADLWYGDAFRVYGEFLYAENSNQKLTPLPIDRNRGDMLNLFVDIKLADIDDHGAYLRLGRQELLFGSQRLVSPLDWANTRRTFQGASAFRQGEKFDATAFWVQPVIPDARNFDSVDDNVNFAGLFTTYRPEKGHFLDMYYFYLNNANNTTQLNLQRAPHTTHTLGTRYAGDRNHVLWDGEAMVQVGNVGQGDLFAGAATAGLGYNFDKLPMNPTFWAYYDWASGTSRPAAGGTSHTFNQLFPFGHYYFGFLDDAARQNIQDINAHVFLYPTKWITLNAQYHHFYLAESRDALYNAAGVPFRRDATGRAGHNVGDEIDLLANFHLGAHSDFLIGYSVLFPGRFIEQTVGAATRNSQRNQQLFYAQYTFRW